MIMEQPKTRKHCLWWGIVCTVLLLLSSCVNDSGSGACDNTTGKAYINLRFSTNTLTTRTSKALGMDENPGTTAESNFKTLRVWIFDSNANDDSKPLSYTEELNALRLQQSDGTLQLQMSIPQTEQKQNIDLYILANSESIGDTKLGANSTKQDLQNADFGGDHFGITTNGKPNAEKVPEEGLPMARIVTDISVKQFASTEQYDRTNIIKIPLLRNVTKLHFFFAKQTDAEGTITGITLKENQIASAEKIFPGNVTYSDNIQNPKTAFISGANYIPNDLTYTGTPLLSSNQIKAVDDPETLKRIDGEAASIYMKRLFQGATEYGLSYLRETDKNVTGTISYTLGGGTPQTATFTIDKANFLRNHEIVIYAYFTNKTDLNLQYQVIPWEDGGGSVDFE